jgi:UDP-N-acetylglucosamine 2-epimerase (non-hydrolysing)
MKLLSIFGTRPEAVKIAPILLALDFELFVESTVCVTGQHRDLLDPVLDYFSVVPNFDLGAMKPGQSLNALLARLIAGIDAVLDEVRPDRVLVQGDTTSALAGAWSAFQRGIPVAHVEAGLRTYCMTAPFPEEVNRRAIALMSDLHFAPTPGAKANLMAERLKGEVFVTGNTGIDALKLVLARLGEEEPAAGPGRKTVLVTCHRRESFGLPFASICTALERLGGRGDVDILFPSHPNPALDAAAGGLRNLPPQSFPDFVRLMRRADLILTDSGGIQEEAASLGRPVVVLREGTERPEGVAAGAVILAGSDPDRIVRAAEDVLDRGVRPGGPSEIYGDGHAARRIVDALLGRTVEEFAPVIPARDRMPQFG